MRSDRQVIALLVLLGLLFGLGDYPYVDEFFPSPVVAGDVHHSGSDDQRMHLHSNVVSCYAALASAIVTAAVVIAIQVSHTPPIPADDVRLQLSRRPDQIERPPKLESFG
jgi:hypothetical protein